MTQAQRVAAFILLLTLASMSHADRPISAMDGTFNLKNAPSSQPIDENWRGHSALAFDIRQSNPTPLWLTLSYIDGQFRQYQTRILKVPSARTWTSIQLDFSPSTADWYPAGHMVGFHLDSLRQVRSLGLSWTGGDNATVEIRKARLLASQAATSVEVYELALPNGSRAGELSELRFKLSQSYDNPFDPTEAMVNVKVSGPTGSVTYPAFYRQRYTDGAGAPEAIGAPEWCARIRPRAQGKYHAEIVVAGRYQLRTRPIAFNIIAPAIDRSHIAEQTYTQALRNRLDRQHQTCLNFHDGQWRKADTPAHNGQFAYWDVHLQWSSSQTDAISCERFDLAHADKLDRALGAAERAGARHPMLLFTNEMFHDVTAHKAYPHRWHTNPYNAATGGPLNKPSAFFTHPDASKHSAALLRYVVARYGQFRACESLVLGADFRTPNGTTAWHRQMGDAWQQLANKLPTIPPLLSLHPQIIANPLTPISANFRAAPSTPGQYISNDVLDWSVIDQLYLDVTVPRTAKADTRAAFAFRDDGGWWYQTLLPYFLRPGDVHRIKIDLGDASPMQAMAHPRPWSPYVRMGINSPQVRFYSDSLPADPFVVLVLGGTRNAQRGPLAVHDLSLQKTVVRHSVQELQFHLSRHYPNPFDPQQVRVDAHIESEDGRVTVPAFFYQAYKDIETKTGLKSVAHGQPTWMLRHRVDTLGQHKVVITVAENGEAPTTAGRCDFTVVKSDSGDSPAPVLSANRQRFVMAADVSYRSMSRLQEEVWQPIRDVHGHPASTESTDVVALDKLWAAPLEWNRNWHQGYLGRGRFNLQYAAALDQAIKEAEHTGDRLPMRLFGNEEFHDVSSNVKYRYRWSENPYRQRFGGPLTRASQFFTNPSCGSAGVALIRYLIARYGVFSAVSGWVIANDMPEFGDRGWHDRMTAELAKYAYLKDKSAWSAHPAAQQQTPSSTHNLGEGWLETKTLSTKTEPTPKGNEPRGHESRAFSQQRAEWPAVHRLMAKFDLPADAPGDCRVVLNIQDDDDWWYQMVHRAFLRPGDQTTLLFDLATHAEITPLGHGRPWGDYPRNRIKTLAFRVFTSAAYDGPLGLLHVQGERYPTPESPLVAVAFDTPELVAAGDRYEATFRLNREFANPFSPEEVDIFAMVTTPSGKERRINAWFNQDYKQSQKRLIPMGAPAWKLRFSPRAAGKYRLQYRAKVAGADHVLGDFALQVRGDSSTPKPTTEPPYASPSLLRVHDLSYRTPAEYRQRQWRATRNDKNLAAQALWQPVLEWTKRWGKYHDLGRYNLEAAHHFEQELDRAAADGWRFPLRLNGVMEFHNRRKHRWPDNPLNAANGGPLERPSDYYRSPEALANQVQLWRYLTARYGDHPAVSDLVLASDYAAEGVERWHRKAGSALRNLLAEGQRLRSYHPQAITHWVNNMVATFERGTDAFEPAVEIQGGSETQVDVHSAGATHGKQALRVRRRFVGRGEAPIMANIDQDWYAFDTLAMDIRIPSDAPENMRVMLFVKDGDMWYYENFLKSPLVPGDITRFVVDLTGTDGAWVPPPADDAPVHLRHSKPWDAGTRRRIRQLGVRLFAHEAFAGEFTIDNVQLWGTGRHKQPKTPELTFVRSSNQEIGRYEQFELSFGLNQVFHNPFDADQANVLVTVTRPDGKSQDIPAFYFQDYERYLITQRCNTHNQDEKFEHLVPRGAPYWKARIAGRDLGQHQLQISVNGTAVPSSIREFTVSPSDAPGFIRVAKDKRHFEHANGAFFYPIGQNLRSPTDSRNNNVYKPFFEQQWHHGTYLYDDYFAKMHTNGFNYARVWQCSWWLGLEWTRAWHGYHGLGYYNLENAWRLDYLLTAAQKHGIYLQLDTTNHGQYSVDIDSEWAHNPYNAESVDKGPLWQPREFFTEAEAKAQYAKRVRYTCARWGQDPQVFSWVVLTECEFTDPYFAQAYKKGWQGRSPLLVSWHQFATDAFRRWDSNHLVATHFSHPFRGPDVFADASVSFVQSNSYWQNWWFKKAKGGPANNTPWIHDYAFRNLLGNHGKPVLIGEFGGHVKKNSAAHLDIELHVGSWSMACTPYAGCTGYWWWPWLHYRDRYGTVGNVAKFMAGEDRRNINLKQATLEVDRGLQYAAVSGEGMCDAWIYHPQVLRSARKDITPVADARVRFEAKNWPAARVEFWNTYHGKVMDTATVIAENGQLSIPLPPVRGDLALKIRMAAAPAPPAQPAPLDPDATGH